MRPGPTSGRRKAWRASERTGRVHADVEAGCVCTGVVGQAGAGDRRAGVQARLAVSTSPPQASACSTPAQAWTLHTLRSWMVVLKERLSEVGIQAWRTPVRLPVDGPLRPAGDDEVPPGRGTGTVHADPGLRAVEGRSRLFLADYTRAAVRPGHHPAAVLERLQPDVPERARNCWVATSRNCPSRRAATPGYCVINNSSLPFTEARTNPLGVMHKAEIVTPDETRTPDRELDDAGHGGRRDRPGASSGSSSAPIRSARRTIEDQHDSR